MPDERLSGAQRRMLRAAIDAEGDAFTVEELARLAGVQRPLDAERTADSLIGKGYFAGELGGPYSVTPAGVQRRPAQGGGPPPTVGTAATAARARELLKQTDPATGRKYTKVAVAAELKIHRNTLHALLNPQAAKRQRVARRVSTTKQRGEPSV